MFDVEFCRDGSRLAACGADRTIRFFDVAERQEMRRIEAHADWVMAIAWSPDGTKLASAGRDKAAKLIDAATGMVLVTYPGHDEQVLTCFFRPVATRCFRPGAGEKYIAGASTENRQANPTFAKRDRGDRRANARRYFTRLSLSGDHVLAASADGKLSQFDPDKNDVREPAIVYEGAPPQAFSLATS